MKLTAYIYAMILVSSTGMAQVQRDDNWKNLDLESSSIVYSKLAVKEIQGLVAQGITFFHKNIPNTVICQKSAFNHKPVNAYSCSININATTKNLSHFYKHLLVGETLVDHQEFPDHGFDVTYKAAGTMAITQSRRDCFKTGDSREEFVFNFKHDLEGAIKRAQGLITQDDL